MASDMVHDHSDSKKGNPLLPLHGPPFPINLQQGIFYTYHPTDKIVHNIRKHIYQF